VRYKYQIIILSITILFISACEERNIESLQEIQFDIDNVKYTVNCTTFDIQKCTTLKNKRKTGFSLTKLDQNVQSGYVLYSKNPT